MITITSCHTLTLCSRIRQELVYYTSEDQAQRARVACVMACYMVTLGKIIVVSHTTLRCARSPSSSNRQNLSLATSFGCIHRMASFATWKPHR